VIQQKYVVIALLALMAAAGCAKRSEPMKRYALSGKVIATDVSASQVVVEHKAIPGFMEAMTMSFPVKDAAALRSLAPGDEIAADLVVQGPNHWLENIRVTKKNASPKPQSLQFHVPQVGDPVPDFALINQSGQRVKLSRYRGKVLLVTFIYTRCPFPDYCPRVSGFFAELNRRMLASPETSRRTHLLSISFDPAHDTPAVLRKYGAAYVEGSPDPKFDHWEFAVPAKEDVLQRMAKFFGLTYEPESGLITHSLSTTVISPDGHVFRWYHGSEWKPDDLMRDVDEALRPAG
jgi:protein SCO1